jgi:outer membrane immunogenic protein
VIGAEGDWDWANIGHTQSFALSSSQMNVSETLTLRSRGGVAFDRASRGGVAFDRALVYVTGGYAGVNANASFSTPFAGWGGSQSQWISGGAVGAGVEYAFTNNITAKAEYLYLPLSSTSFFNPPYYLTRAPVDLSLLRARVNYKF